MSSDTYIISYTVTYPNGEEANGKMKVHRRYSELHAKIKLGEFLKDKMGTGISIDIHSCRKQLNIDNLFNGLFK